jgi:hypothetical protein
MEGIGPVVNGMVEEVPVAKQTGRGYGVKCVRSLAAMRLAAAGTLLVLLGACASTWHNSGKTPAEAKADEQQCANDAQDITFTRTAQDRITYGHDTDPLPGMSRGETPIQMQDRVKTENAYTHEFESCMTSKGYTQGKSENP